MPEECVKSVQSNNKDTKTMSMTLALTLNRFYTLLGCFHC